jgi:hypothetical protein
MTGGGCIRRVVNPLYYQANAVRAAAYGGMEPPPVLIISRFCPLANRARPIRYVRWTST